MMLKSIELSVFSTESEIEKETQERKSHHNIVAISVKQNLLDRLRGKKIQHIPQI